MRSRAGKRSGRSGSVSTSRARSRGSRLSRSAVLVDHLADILRKFLRQNFSRRFARDPAPRIDENQGRPGVHGIRIPDLKPGIIHDRVFNTVPHHRLADIFGGVLSRELARMNTDDDQLLWKLLS